MATSSLPSCCSCSPWTWQLVIDKSAGVRRYTNRCHESCVLCFKEHNTQVYVCVTVVDFLGTTDCEYSCCGHTQYGSFMDRYCPPCAVCFVPHCNYMQIIFIVWGMIRVQSCRWFHASFWASWMGRGLHQPHPNPHCRLSFPLQVGSRLVPKEVALLLRLDHRYIIQLLDYFEEEEKYVIVMERPEKYIDLFDYITQKEVLSERTAKHLFRWAREGQVQLDFYFGSM